MAKTIFFFYVRRDAEISELNNTVEDNQALIASLQRKIKELEVWFLLSEVLKGTVVYRKFQHSNHEIFHQLQWATD